MVAEAAAKKAAKVRAKRQALVMAKAAARAQAALLQCSAALEAKLANAHTAKTTDVRKPSPLSSREGGATA